MKYLINLSILFFICFFATVKVFSEPLPKVEYATVVFPKGRVFQLELAKTQEQWIRGLMFRKHLAKNSGMLFVYPKEDYYAIWMKNCFIPLDLIWLDSKGRIIYFVENAPPCRKDPCPVYQPIMKARYVIELNGGTIKGLHLNIGDRVDILFQK